MKVVKVTELRALDVIDVLGESREVLHWTRDEALIQVDFVVAPGPGHLDMMLYQEDEYVALLGRLWPPGSNQASMLRRVVTLAEEFQNISIDFSRGETDTSAADAAVVKLQEVCETYLLGLPRMRVT